jgi:hypothetical protein
LLSGGGCADNRATLFIVQVNAPDTSTCITKNTIDSDIYLRGVLDRAFTKEYKADLLVGNQMVERGNKDTAQAETSRVNLEWADVSIENEATGDVVASYREAVSGFVDASKGTDPGYGLARVTLVSMKASLSVMPDGDTTSTSSKPVRLVSVVKVSGKSLGGVDVESGEFRFPVTVCYGCLYAGGDCSASSTSTTTGPCVVGNDMGVSCKVCQLTASDTTICK